MSSLQGEQDKCNNQDQEMHLTLPSSGAAAPFAASIESNGCGSQPHQSTCSTISTSPPSSPVSAWPSLLSSPTAAAFGRVARQVATVSQQWARYASTRARSALSSASQLQSVSKDKATDDATPSTSEAANPMRDALLMPEVMLGVFSNLTSSQYELLRQLSLVCQVWHDTARAPELWRAQLDPCVLQLLLSGAMTAQAPPPPSMLPSLVLALHCRNFLRNPCFCKALNIERAAWSTWRRNAWVITTSGGNGVNWEQSPEGLPLATFPPPPLPYAGGGQLPGLARKMQSKLHEFLTPQKPTCLATSFDWSEAVQVVDMVEELGHRGLTREQACAVLDSGVCLGFSVYIGGREDCSSSFAVGLQLDEGEGDVVPSIQNFVMKPGRYHFYTYRLEPLQGKWARFAHLVDPCPKGFRRATIILRGRDNRAWAGHYGAKFACAQLSFVLPSAKEEFMASMRTMESWTRIRPPGHVPPADLQPPMHH